MDTRAWRVAGGAAVALLVLVGLVAWRADSLAGGWLAALRVTGVLAVAGLLTAVVLASLAALRPPSPPEVVVRVGATGAPRTSARPARRALVPLTAVLLLAVVTAAPVLVVLVLATGPRSGASTDAGATSARPGDASPTPSDPTTTSPTTPETTPAPTAEPSAEPTAEPTAEPDPQRAPSPSQLPSQGSGTAASPVVCELVVAAGDTLWGLAEQQLGADARDADVDARWRALYARNASAVGPDPDLIRPGLALRTCA